MEQCSAATFARMNLTIRKKLLRTFLLLLFNGDVSGHPPRTTNVGLWVRLVLLSSSSSTEVRVSGGLGPSNVFGVTSFLPFLI